MCGIYIPVSDLADGKLHDYRFEINVPFTDFLKYQAFTLYPNNICDEIDEELYTSILGMVWAPIDPVVVYEHEGKIKDLNGLELAEKEYNITRKFVQVGNPATIPTTATVNNNKLSLTTGKATLRVVSYGVTALRSNIAGFMVKEDVKNQIFNFLADRAASGNPVILPSQSLERRPYQQRPLANGFDGTLDVVLSSTTSISVVFPRYPTDVTCFENIMCQNMSLNVNKVQFPDIPFATNDARFYQMQLVANELDGSNEPTQEFEDSITHVRNYVDKDGIHRLEDVGTDNTSFMITFQLERSNGGYVFDGVDSGTETVPITLRGTPIYPGNSDTYYNPDPTNLLVCPPHPELWICTDTFFLLQPREYGGLVYNGQVIPEGYD